MNDDLTEAYEECLFAHSMGEEYCHDMIVRNLYRTYPHLEGKPRITELLADMSPEEIAGVMLADAMYRAPDIVAECLEFLDDLSGH